MEVFMHNINWEYNKFQVTTELALLLHGPGFADLSSTRINFHVHLHADRKKIRNHGGTGTLTLPTLEIGRRFLNLIGTEDRNHRISLVLGQKVVRFQESKRPSGRADVVESITLLPYMDPWVAQERERRVAQLGAEDVAIRVLQFGWDCRDQVFSVESEEHCEGHCSVGFHAERRELRVKLMNNLNTDTYNVVIHYSHINSITAHHYLSDAVIILFLNTPPTYERDQTPLRQRLSHLPIPDHERVAPYASLVIRLVCASPHELQKFRRLSNVAQLHNLYDYEYHIEHRYLFSVGAMERLQTWLRRFNWAVAFQIESLVRSMVIDVTEAVELMPEIYRVVSSKGKTFAASTLRKFASHAKLLYWNVDEDIEQISVLQCFLNAETENSKQASVKLLKPSEGSLFDAFHVTITPTTMFLEGPLPERSNRVIRLYDPAHHESFLRVSFMDEARLRYRFDREVDGPAFIRSRVGPILLNGLTIARRTFHFLAYSQSALKEHAVWFVKAFRDRQRGYIDAETIIAGLGDFKKRDEKLVYCPARYAARISQAFTATDAVSVEVEEVFNIPDIDTSDASYQFTDGVGTLSPDLARDINQQLKPNKRRARNPKAHPSAFQIRFMGSKGMVSVDHKLTGHAICLRPSMIKFEAPDSREIEIARAFDRPGAYYLNRPLIMLLEGLGVPFEIFERYQTMAVREAQKATQSLKQAASMLESFGLGTSYRISSVLLSLEKLQISSLPGNSFYEKMLEYAINHVLRQLKNHARIPIPNAWTLVGVADVHSFLKPGEIFACVKPMNGKAIYLEGPILISRSPTIHPGDVMIVHAIGRPPPNSCFAIEPLANTVVFSVLGTRPIPSCLGGGDLDGDVYNLIPLEKLPEFRPSKSHAPANYEPAPKKLLDRPSTMADVAEFVMEYINSDAVGIIAINWLIIADQSPRSIFDPDCITLANLHSSAVDYPKTGQPISLNRIPKLKHRRKPDWNAPETVHANSENYYPSGSAIGRLFRAIDLPVEQPGHRPRQGRKKQRRSGAVEGVIDRFINFNLQEARDDPLFDAVEDVVRDFVDTDGPWPDAEINFVKNLLDRYTSELQGICAANTLSHARTALLSEEEAIIGTIVQKTSQSRKRTDMMSKLRENTDLLVRAIREELAGDDEVSDEKSLERAWLAWELSVAQDKTFGAQSFGWVALGAIFEAVKQIEEGYLTKG
ncbi:RNA-directed RNA polymerase 2 [Crassisporium funariophilum]|nr:RNA-directed RNA polymerase 2 [Crassisporium funariophilum]